MEVHAHAHTERKKWTHYLWEFLMLFLAVFFGFLAENQREHMVEHKREKEYISSMINDLEKDTAALHQCISNTNFKNAIYDSLSNLLKSQNVLSNTQLLYYYFLPTCSYNFFNASQGTIRQLENAGGLRLIRNKQAIDSITEYYSLVRDAENQFNTYMRYFDQYHEVSLRVFDFSQVDTIFYTRERILTEKTDYTLLTNEKSTIKLLYNKLYTLRLILDNYLLYLNALEEVAKTTLEFLNKEYHLK
jgi:hypothetical protein